ncbi:MAG: hypothetical protein ABFS08_00825 [Pseudomonadota bacterium]
MMFRYAVPLFLLLVSAVLSASEPMGEELERWFEDDEQSLPYADYSSDAELRFLEPITDKRIPHSHTRLQLTAESLSSGWVGLSQCHDELDPVPDAEVVYRFRAMRGLQVSESVNITSAEVEGQSVQLKDIGHQARLCVTAEVQILNRTPDGEYHLRYGPFQRKFLDSYFPLHVSLQIYYPSQAIVLTEISPPPENAYQLSRDQGSAAADVWFSGELTFEIGFTAAR